MCRKDRRHERLLWSECSCLPTYPPEFILLNPNPQVMVLRDEAFAHWLSNDSKALETGLSTLTKETPESQLPLGYSEKEPSSNTESASTRILEFSASGTGRDKCLLWISHLVYGVFVEQSKETKTGIKESKVQGGVGDLSFVWSQKFS